MLLTCPKVEADAAEEVLVAEAVVVPDCQLDAAVRHLLQREVVPAHRLLPAGARRPPADAGLLLAAARVTGQQVAADREVSRQFAIDTEYNV